MAEWRLTEADLGDPDKKAGIVEGRCATRSSPPRWELSIGCICEELFQVKSFVRSFGSRKTLCFVGYPDDVELAKEAFAFLKAQVLQLGRRYYNDSGCSVSQWSSYCTGVVSRVRARVQEAALADDADQAERCRALVVRRAEEVQEYAKKHLQFKPARASRRVVDEHFFSGYRDGGKVRFEMSKRLEAA